MHTIDFAGYEHLTKAIRNGTFPARCLQVLHCGSFEPIEPWGAVFTPMELTDDLTAVGADVEVFGMEQRIVSAWGFRFLDPVTGTVKDIPFERGPRALQNGDQLRVTLQFKSC